MTSDQSTIGEIVTQNDYQKPYVFKREGAHVPESWNIVKFDDILELEYGKALTKADREPGPYPVFGSNGRSGWHSDFHIESPGIIVGRKGVNLGIEWSDENFNVIDTAYFINNDSIKVDGVDLRFLYYNLLDFDLDRLKSGSAVPGLNRDDFYHQTIALPPLDEQKSIAHMLTILDRKIEVNEKIKNVSEEIADTLFEDEFLRLDKSAAFKDSEIGKIPERFEITTIEEVIDSGRGYSYTSEYLDKENELDDSYPMINLKNILEGGGFRTDGYKYYTEDSMKDRYLIEEDDLIVAITDLTQEGRVIGSPAIIPKLDNKMNIISQDVAKITPKSVPREYLYYLFKTDMFQDYARSRATGTTVLHLSLTSIGEFEFALPPEEEIEDFVARVRPIIESKKEVIEENGVLSGIRDTLLPKLMVGELETHMDQENLRTLGQQD